MTPQETVAKVKQAIEDKYAWPGGYPYYIVMSDGEAMSVAAAKDNWPQIEAATLAGERDDWAAVGAEINWEDGNLICCQTGEKIESAYAEEE